MSSAERTNERAIKSTPSFKINSKSFLSLAVKAGALIDAVGRLIPLKDFNIPPTITFAFIEKSFLSKTLSSILPSSNKRISPNDTSLGKLLY